MSEPTIRYLIREQRAARTVVPGLTRTTWVALGTVEVPVWADKPDDVALEVGRVLWPDRPTVARRLAARTAEVCAARTAAERVADDEDGYRCALIARWREACRRARPEGM